jgi:hypothetical protein
MLTLSRQLAEFGVGTTPAAGSTLVSPSWATAG